MIKIFRCSALHAEELTSIAIQAKQHWNYPDHYIELWRTDLTLTPGWVRSNMVYAGAIRGRIVGFYALSRRENTFELEHMWVRPEWMERGVGQSLFSHAEGVVRKQNGALLRIVSDPNAEPFYLKMGALRTGSMPSLPAGRYLPVLEYQLDEIQIP